MTIYGLNYSPLITPMTDKTKGSKANRAKCAGEQYLSNLKAAAASTAVIGDAYVAATHPDKITNLASKAKNTVAPYAQKLASSSVGQKAKTLLGKFKSLKGVQGATNWIKAQGAKLTPHLKNFASEMKGVAKNVVKFAKAHPVIAAVATTALAVISLNQAFEAGKIDQKYTDKAKYENA